MTVFYFYDRDGALFDVMKVIDPRPIVGLLDFPCFAGCTVHIRFEE